MREVGENTRSVFEPYEPKGAHRAISGVVGIYNLVGAAKINNDPMGRFLFSYS